MEIGSTSRLAPVPTVRRRCLSTNWDEQKCILIGGCEVLFSFEDPGIRISFDGDIAEDLAGTRSSEVLERIREITGQQGELNRIT